MQLNKRKGVKLLSKKHFLKLRGAVAENGYVLKDLAKELNIAQQTLNEKLHGRKQFTLDEMIRTCNFLGTDMDIFFDPELHNLQFKQD
jgi:transcriptional regulator with XRE-family HTH domain